MKKIIHKIGQALQVILLAPVKLPGKVPTILKYLAIGVGIMEALTDEQGGEKKAPDEQRGGEDENQ
ncbi:hypothetical protein BWD42_23990 [Sphingobacterium sp. CZ-UAM]|uniref:hypothetical protein n=1 Tax=Sphingobacterium sp. CZ-UAM TaxID=1933868 RepID=UPI00098448FF|nr:hypothetical protein [Sphingobacterium sp. CZ-UAM]OOG15745.1 hypothetical protein BWD42_23990 [Sphingobacterium sp. CZ-UAM]